MRGINVQKIVIEKEENEKLYRALDLLSEFRNTFGNMIDEVDLTNVDALNDLCGDIGYIVERLGEFLDDLGYCDCIEIEG